MQFEDRDAFVEYMGQGQPTRPANILEIVAINQGKSPLTMEEPTAPALRPREVVELIEQRHAIIDAREPAAFGAGHIPGAYNFKLASPEFEQRVGWVIPLGEPMLLVLDDDSSLRRALHKLAFIGLDQRVKGYLAGGMGAWSAAGMQQETLPQISVNELHRHLDNGDDMKVLDVREQDEWDEGHIEGATLMNFKVLEQHLDQIPIDHDEPVSVTCAGGIRSSTACSILLRNGYRQVHNLTGGMSAWKAAKLPTVSD